MRLFIALLFGSVEMFITERLESSEVRKIPVACFPFLNLKNIMPGYILFK